MVHMQFLFHRKFFLSSFSSIDSSIPYIPVLLSQSNHSLLPTHQSHPFVSTAKQLKAIQLNEKDLTESFVKGSGKGGQKINKVRNCVLLTHLPTGFQVRTQKTRSLDHNRRIARQLLQQKLDDYWNGPGSKQNRKIEQLRRKKANRRAKSKQKYAKAHMEVNEEIASEDETQEDGEDTVKY